MVRRLRSEGYWVRGADLKNTEYGPSEANDFVIADLRLRQSWETLLDEGMDEVYQLAADMGGAGYIFTGEHDAQVMHNSATINLNCLEYGRLAGVKKFFYSSSACMYPEYNQTDPNNPKCAEDSAYPAAPDSEYGWEKLFSERLYLAYMRNYGIQVRIARFHNIFGPEGTWVAAVKRPPPPSAAKSPKRTTEERSKSGVMDSKPAPSSTSTNASRRRRLMGRIFHRARSTSARRKWSPSTRWPR